MSGFNQQHATAHAQAWPYPLPDARSGPIVKAINDLSKLEAVNGDPLDHLWPHAAFRIDHAHKHFAAVLRDHLVPLRSARCAA